MSMKKVDSKLLKKYFDGGCTDEEKKAVEAWLESGHYHEPLNLPDKTKGYYKELMWKNISAGFGPATAPKVVPLHKKMMRYAAVVIIFLSVGAAAYFYLNHLDPDRTLDPVAQDDHRTIETQRGQKRTVKLPDGSTIRLNYESQIKVPVRFTDSERMVFLQGHAHFDVARDPNRPFIIYTENSKTQVLGTSFDIRTYKNTDETEIIVTSGRVAFSDKSEDQNLVTLTVNGRAVLNADKSIETSEVDAQKLTAWKDNRLIFEDQTLREIIEVLQPWYDVEITVEDTNQFEMEYNFSFDNPSLDVLIEQMSFMGKFEYAIEGKQVTIY